MPSTKTIHIQFNKDNKYLGKVNPGHDIQDGHFNVEVSHDEHEDVEKNHEQAEYIHKFLGGKCKIDNEKRLEGLVKTESTLAELAKQTLKNYIKANVEDRLLRQTGASFKSGKSGDEFNKAEETDVDKKREKGMETALNKLTKEDLDESLNDKNKIFHGVFIRDTNGNYSHDSTHKLRSDAQDAVDSHEAKGAFHVPLSQDEAKSLNNADHTSINALMQSKRKSGIKGTFKMNEMNESFKEFAKMDADTLSIEAFKATKAANDSNSISKHHTASKLHSMAAMKHADNGVADLAAMHDKHYNKHLDKVESMSGYIKESFGAKILSAIINNKPIQAQEEFAMGLSSIIKDRIETRKQEIAKSVFGGTEPSN